MRRRDREVTRKEEIFDIIDQCKVCRIAMIDNGKPYIVPMNFGYEEIDDKLIFYFHSAKQGRKIDIMKSNNQVCVEMDCEHQLVEADIACDYGYYFASLIGNGTVNFIDEITLKKHALLKIMSHQTGRDDFTFDDKSVQSVAVFQIIMDDYAGKRKPKISNRPINEKRNEE
ncbi:MAG: 5-nitroimidazole antibiotic resistance protein [Clostridiales bacterium]|jgi:nitroimidazol reductase NimA-like FMN-containing flavoprotein (pyridoxamine 5'-phosphate oxidase superfamily)|nr:5-nitroimidazole antibiotic resistance protein [Clostridiales bacterium]